MISYKSSVTVLAFRVRFLLRCLFIETVIWLFREELAEGKCLEECRQLIENMKAAYGLVTDIQKDITDIQLRAEY